MLFPNSRPAHKQRRLFRFLLLSSVILGLGLLIRLTDLYQLPVFLDEGTHIGWAQQVFAKKVPYPFLMDGKILLGFTLALFTRGAAPLWIARAVEAVFSTLSGAACIALGSRLSSRRVGLIAGLIYAVMPYAIFHERQVLADPMSVAWGAVAVVLAVRLASKRRLWLVVPLALTLAAAILVKLTSIVYLAFLCLAVIFLPASRIERRNLAAKYGAAVILSGVAIGLFLVAFSGKLSSGGGLGDMQQAGFVGCPPLICGGDWQEQVRVLQASGQVLLEMVAPYFGWPMVVLAGLALWSTERRHRALTATCFFALLAMVFGLAMSVMPGFTIPPRYFSFISVFLAALAAQGLVSLAQRVTRRIGVASPRRVEFALIGLMTLAIGGSLINTVPITFNSAQAQLPLIDQWQYQTGNNVADGLREVAGIILAKADKPVRPLIISSRSNQIAAYFGTGQVDTLSNVSDWRAAVGNGLIRGLTMYVVDDGPTCEPNPDPVYPGLELTELACYPHQAAAGRLRLLGVAGVDATLRQELFQRLVSPPSDLVPDDKALADYLAQQNSDGVMLVYPPVYLADWSQLFKNVSGLQVHGIGDSWPLDEEKTAVTLQQVTVGHANISMVFPQENQGDPDRFVEMWLNTRLYRLGEQWFGARRLVEFAGDGPVAEGVSVNARFGDHIVLDGMEILDNTPRPGGIVRLRLTWHTDKLFSRPLKVFVHLFNSPGIAAQHDGQPVGELRPTTTWQADESIIDQFAIRLPPSIAAGAYQLRIGLYDAKTQDRLPARLSDGTPSEFYVGGAIMVQP